MNMLRLHVKKNHGAENLKPDEDVDSGKAGSAEVPPHNSLVKGCETCPICSKMFYDHFNVKRHIKTEHEKAERCECTECEKSFSNQYSLNYHVKACHKKDSFFTCAVCEETFKTIAGLCKHKKSAHTKEVTIECRYCGIHLNSRSNLNRHKQEIHCKGTRFDTSRIEVSLFSIACDQCDFVAKRNFHLIRHVKNKHETDEQCNNLSEEEKKTCPHCYKIFCGKSNLKRHVLSWCQI